MRDIDKKLFAAIRNTNIDGVKKAIENGANVNSKDERGNTPLHECYRSVLTEIPALLIEKGAFVLALNKEQATPEDTVNVYTTGNKDKVIKLLQKETQELLKLLNDTSIAIVQKAIDKLYAPAIEAAKGTKQKTALQKKCGKHTERLQKNHDETNEIKELIKKYLQRDTKFIEAFRVQKCNDNRSALDSYIERAGDYLSSEVLNFKNNNSKGFVVRLQRPLPATLKPDAIQVAHGFGLAWSQTARKFPIHGLPLDVLKFVMSYIIKEIDPEEPKKILEKACNAFTLGYNDGKKPIAIKGQARTESDIRKVINPDVGNSRG